MHSRAQQKTGSYFHIFFTYFTFVDFHKPPSRFVVAMAVLPPDPLYTFRNADMGAVNCICFHRAERLISGTARGSVYLFDLQSNRVAHHFTLPPASKGTAPAALTAVQKHDETLHTQQRDGTVAAWSLSNTGYELDHGWQTDYTGFCRIEVSAERGWLLAPLAGESIGVYDLRQPGQLVVKLEPPSAAGGDDDDGGGSAVTNANNADGNTTAASGAPPAAVPSTDASTSSASLGQLMCFKYVPINGQDYVLGCYESGEFVTWDVRAGGARLADRQRIADECPLTVDYDAQTNRGIYAGPSDRMGVFGYNRNTMRLQQRSEIAMKTAGVNCVRIRGDRRVFCTGGWDGKVRVYSWSSLRPLAVLTEHRAAVSEITYSVGKVSLWNAPVMAVASADGLISLWDLYN